MDEITDIVLHVHTYIYLCNSVHNIQPCFCASSLALAFSIFAILAADLEPKTPPPQCRLISSKRSLKLVLIASTTFAKAARSPESTCAQQIFCITCNNIEWEQPYSYPVKFSYILTCRTSSTDK